MEPYHTAPQRSKSRRVMEFFCPCRAHVTDCPTQGDAQGYVLMAFQAVCMQEYNTCNILLSPFVDSSFKIPIFAARYDRLKYITG